MDGDWSWFNYVQDKEQSSSNGEIIRKVDDKTSTADIYEEDIDEMQAYIETQIKDELKALLEEEAGLKIEETDDELLTNIATKLKEDSPDKIIENLPNTNCQHWHHQ